LIERLLNHYETPSPLAAWNPSVKAVTIAATSLLLTFVLDPVTPLLCFAFTMVALVAVGRAPLGPLLAGLAPALGVGFGLWWTNALFAREAGAVLWTWGPLRVGEHGLWMGAALAARVLGFAAYSLLFVATTNPSAFIVSAIVTLRLPVPLGYALLAVYRFLPTLAAEYQLIRGAHRIRGESAAGPFARWRDRALRYTVPLLASSIRRAERVALAMEARGLLAGRPRTYYRRPPLGGRDFVLAAAFMAAHAALLWLSWRWGTLRWWRGQLY
jgi:energy-coupling factor transport system permease protein